MSGPLRRGVGASWLRGRETGWSLVEPWGAFWDLG